MKSLNVSGENDLLDSLLEDLQPEELFYIRLPSVEASDSALLFMAKAALKSSQVFVSIPGEDFSKKDHIDAIFSAGIKGLALRLSHLVEKWLKHEGAGQFYSGDRDLIKFFRDCKEKIPKKREIIVEFQVGHDVRVLAPTITGLYEDGVSWIVLNVEGAPSPERCYQLREVFEYLKIRSCGKLNIYFPFWNPYYEEWTIKTQNTFSGLEYVHLDISNRCTHSCVFCGLYGPDALEERRKQGGGKIPDNITDFMKMEINPETGFGIIQSLPWSVKQIQFGGFGDPLMHDHAVEFIAAARRRGFKVEILSNMEYLDDDDILTLHKLGSKHPHDLHFIANISGGDPETYIKTRPKQTPKQFQKIVHNLKRFSELKKENNGAGVFVTLMCVVNKDNYHSLGKVSELAEEIGAHRVWFKPMEVHTEVHWKQLPPLEVLGEMASSLSLAMKQAEAKNVEIFGKDYCQQIVQKIEKISSESKLASKKDYKVMIAELSVDIANAGVPAKYYSENPCLVGYSYIRFEVSGKIAPCCIAKHTIGNASKQDWRDVWHSGAYENFRRKMARIHIDRFHLKDPEWTFCQQCSHMDLNRDKNNLLKKKSIS